VDFDSVRFCLCSQLSTINFQPTSLPLIFALVHFFEHGEPGVFRAGKIVSFQRIEFGKDFAHRLFARGAIRERLGRERTVQGEFPAADLAVAFAQFVFVKRHEMNFKVRKYL